MKPEAKRKFKADLFDEFARIGKAVSSGRRLELLEMLAQGERSVEELAAETGQTVANTSQHLQVMRRAQLLDARRDGTHIRYRLASEQVFRFWLSLRELAETRLAEVQRLVDTYCQDRTRLQAIDSKQLKMRLRAGDVVVVDVRPAAEYAAGHVAGARNIPLKELSRRLKELPKSQTIVAYCRGPYCLLADEAAALLESAGFASLRFAGGFPEWKAMGGAIAAAGQA